MSGPVRETDLVTRMLDRLGRSGMVGRELAVRLDLARGTGMVAAWRRVRYERRLRHLEPVAEDPYTRIWREAALEMGAEATVLPGGFVEISSDESWTRVHDNLVMLDDAVTLRFALQKPLVSRLLERAGLPVPQWLEFDRTELEPALRFLRAGPVPCVVKPVGSSSGYAVTSGIHSEEDLLRARLRGARVDKKLMIERQAHGEFYRFLILDGAVLDVVRRHPPRVTGDGHSTIEELIAEENRQRIAKRDRALLQPLRVDLECVLTLRSAGLTLASVLPAGLTIAVKNVVSQATMQDNETIRGPVSSELERAVIRAAALVGLRLAGVDVITTDLAVPLETSRGVILEVNGPPGLHYHYDVADPARATKVAVPILRTLLAESPSAVRTSLQ